MNMEYKYQLDYDNLSQFCPPLDHTAQEINPVYRWVFDTISDERNFKPQYHKKPKRFLNNDDVTKCKALGLSMFNNLEGSMQRYKELKDSMGDNIFETLGNKVSQGKISISDGVNGAIERHGHFNHHPSIKANFKVIFIIKEEIIL